MTIEIYCQKCGQRMEIPDQYAGQTGKCKKCGNPIAVPASGPQSAFKAVPQQQSSEIPYKWIVGSAVGAAVLAIGAYALFLRGGPSDSTASQPAMGAPANRVVEFPRDRLVGQQYFRRSGADGWGREVGQARGSISVGQSQEIGLEVRRPHPTDLSYLRDFGPDDLDYLMLTHPDLPDAQLRHVEHLTGLRSMLIEWSGASDSGIHSVSGLTQLEFLGLNGSNINDAGLSSLLGLTRLEGLHISGTKVTPRGVRSLKALPALWHISLSGTEITPEMVDAINELPVLRTLWIDADFSLDADRRLVPKGPTRPDSIRLLKDATQLRGLMFRGMMHDDSLIPALSELTFLTNIGLFGSSTSPEARDRLRRALPNCTVTP